MPKFVKLKGNDFYHQWNEEQMILINYRSGWCNINENSEGWMEAEIVEAESWADYGVWDFPWSGKWEKNCYTGHMEPLVWYYNDHNGTADNWYLGPIRHVTTGVVVMWTEDRVVAESIAGALNLRKNIREQERSNGIK